MPDPTVGVDISKTHLDAHRVPDGTAARFTNDDAGFKALIAWIKRPVRAVTYEPTGHWHRAFEEALLTAGLPLARVNPLQARRFAQAIGQRAKTDVVDARVLAQMGAALELRPTEMSSPAHRALEELQVARDALIRDRTAALNRQKQIRHRLLKRQNKDAGGPARPASGRHRCRDRKAARRRRSARPPGRDPDIHSGRVPHHRRRPAHPDAGTRPTRRQGGRQPRGARPRHATVRHLARPKLHTGRPGAGATNPLHAGRDRDALQSGPAGEVPTTRRPGKARQGRSGRRHAQAARPRQRTARTGSNLGARAARTGQNAIRRRRAARRCMSFQGGQVSTRSARLWART